MKKLLCIGLCLILLCSCSAGYTRTKFMLDTVCEITVPKGYEEASDKAFDLALELEKLLSRTNQNSEIARLNSSGELTVSDHTAFLINKSLYYSGLSNGLFDITICPVSELWDFKSSKIPDQTEIEKALGRVDYKKIRINGNEVSINDAALDLGAIAKGYIADMSAKVLTDAGVEEGILNFGGNLVLIGNNKGKGYTIGIQTPFQEGCSAYVTLEDTGVATSGTYQRYVEKDGKIFHHILNSKTGYSADTDLDSATVICKNSVDADALSTICILLGKEKAAELIESIPDTEAVFIDKSGNLSYTDGLIGKIKEN